MGAEAVVTVPFEIWVYVGREPLLAGAPVGALVG